MKSVTNWTATFVEVPDPFVGKNARLVGMCVNGNYYEPNWLYENEDFLARSLVETFDLHRENSEWWVVDRETIKECRSNWKNQDIMWQLLELNGEENIDGSITCKGTAEYDIEFMETISPSGDGTKWGPSDFYEEVEQAIKAALAKGPSHTWATGWLACKKEICSTKLECANGSIIAQVSVSDDFDTEGLGISVIPYTQNWDAILKAINEAADKASRDKKENSPVRLYAVGKYCHKTKSRKNWQFTYLVPCGINADFYDQPPGDYYHRWGWQEVDEEADNQDHPFFDPHPEELPTDVAEKLARGMNQGKKSIRCKGWIADTQDEREDEL